MEDLEKYKQLGQELFDKLKLVTFPIAIKIIKPGDEVPKNAFRPLKIFGDPVCTCISLNWVRRSGFSMYFEGEDISCGPSAFLYYGLEECERHPEPVYEGWAKFAGFKRDIDAEKRSRETDSYFKPGEIQGFVASALHTTIVKPDVIMIYCNPLLLSHLILAATYDGDCINSDFNGMESSCKGVVRTYRTKECYVSCPGLGDRSMGGAQDNEMFFFIPESKLEMIVNNLFLAGTKAPGPNPGMPMKLGSQGAAPIFGKQMDLPQWKYTRRKKVKK